jgi:hypothetical protein
LYRGDKIVDYVPMDEIEPISNQYFGQLVYDSF